MSKRQSSIFSLRSLGFAYKHDEFCYEDMTETELQQVLENIARSNLLLGLENDIFERHLARRDPESLQTIDQILEAAKRVQKIAPQRDSASPVMSVTGSITNARDRDVLSVASAQSGGRHVTPSLLTVKTARGGAKITYAQRIEMVNTEIRELLKDLAEFERKSAMRKICLRACMEENEISIRETCETRERFEENVVQTGVDRSLMGKIPAEKFIKFIEEWLKTTDTLVERIRLKTTTVKSQIRKAKLQLKQREELGEALRAVDFEQLHIENQDCIRKIDEKNQYLLEMKKTAGRYGIALTKRKGKLADLTSNVNELKGKIISKNQELVKLQSEQAAIKIEIEKTEAQLKSLITLMDNFSVPEVKDFFEVRAEFEKLQKIHGCLKRREKIRRVMFKSKRQ